MIDTYPPPSVIAQPTAVTVGLRRNSTFLVPGGNAWTPVPFERALWDTDGMFQVSVDPTKLICKTPGRYIVSATAEWGGNTMNRILAIAKNGVRFAMQDAKTGGASETPVTTTLDLAVGDYVQVHAAQDSGVGVNIGASQAGTDLFPYVLNVEASLVSGNSTEPASGTRVFRTTPFFTFSSGNYASVLFYEIDRDSEGMYNPAFPDALYAKKSGWYIVSGHATFTNTSGAGLHRLVAIAKNGSVIFQDSDRMVAGGYSRGNPSGVVWLDKGDYVQLMTMQDSGISMTMGDMHLEAVRLPNVKPESFREAPSCHAVRPSTGTAYTMTNSQFGPVPFTGVEWDTDLMWDGATKLICRTPGKYKVDGMLAWAANATNVRTLNIIKNGAYNASLGAVPEVGSNQDVDTTVIPFVSASTVVDLKAGDFIELWAQQNSGVSLAVTVASLKATLQQPISASALMTPEKVHIVGATGEPAYAAGWAYYGSVFNTPGFWKDADGIVHLRGLCAGTGTTVGTTIFTLPPGYRPVLQELLVAVANNAIARIDVQADGQIKYAAGANGTWVSLDGMTFRAA